MKKLLSLAVLLGTIAALNAQNPIVFKYEGRTYTNGDTLVVECSPSTTSIESIDILNQTNNAISNLTVTLAEIERNGLEAWGLCTGDQCVQDLTSAPFSLEPNEDYTVFSIDIFVENVERPYGVYSMTVGNLLMACNVVLRIQAYSDNLAAPSLAEGASLRAYPNPAEGSFAVDYSVEQPSTLVIYDAQGRTVRQQAVSGNGTLAVGSLPAGVYAYGIVSSHGRSPMQKLIVR